MLKFPICVLLAIVTTSQSFSIGSSRSFIKIQAPPSSSSLQQLQQKQSRWILSLNAESSPSDNDQVEEVEAEITDDEPTTATTEDEASSEEEVDEEPKEDPEITAIKTEITQLETQLKQKNRELNNIENMAEEYTKGGYARKVAEMETYRNSRSAASKDNTTAAKAMALEPFLPILETLVHVRHDYENDEFAKGYNALCSDFQSALKGLGVVEYTVQEGDTVDNTSAGRIVAAREEYSDVFAKGAVIQPVTVGFEIEGNIIKSASAVVSLGPEPVPVEEEQGEDGGESSDGGEEV